MDQIQVEKATKALLAHIRMRKLDVKNKATTENIIAESDADGLNSEVVWTIITTKKIPEKFKSKPVSIRLPNSILSDTAEICMFVKDPQREFKDLIKNAGVTRVSKIIGISKLKSKFIPYEAKRQLCAAYDMFLADERVIPLLPKLIGKTFFNKKKHPATVSLTKKDVKSEIERAIHSTYLHLNKGVCNSIKTGSLKLSQEQNVENIMAVVNKAAEKLPGKWNNIQSVYIKTTTSVALPIYNALHDEPAGDVEKDDESTEVAIKERTIEEIFESEMAEDEPDEPVEPIKAPKKVLPAKEKLTKKANPVSESTDAVPSQGKAVKTTVKTTVKSKVAKKTAKA
ncbi:proteasome-interacting protein cic1 [Batrachochytrium dendrobatidis]|nr:proteasome-interacting protein cic1 [Batrachochytrium dendrobatidis]KAK5671594.1 proteasome-interacting protein cic1 [Batrachochytrium dendrobatidis]